LKRSNRLTARKADSEGITFPPPTAVSLDVVVEAHPIAIWPRIMFAESRILDHRQVAKGMGDDLGGLAGPGILAGDQDISLDLVADRKSISQPFGLLAAELGQPAAGSRPTDHPGHCGLRFSVADEYEAGHRAASLLFVRVRPPVRVSVLSSPRCWELTG